MSASVVPVIYDHTTKKVLRWAILDHESQLRDPAFGPQHLSERVLKVPAQIFKSFRTDPGTGIHVLHQVQDYVKANAP